MFLLIQKHFGAFEIIPNPRDTAPLTERFLGSSRHISSLSSAEVHGRNR